jgi:hypothetical protein
MGGLTQPLPFMDLTVGQRRRDRVASDLRVQQGRMRVPQQLPNIQVAELMLRQLAVSVEGVSASSRDARPSAAPSRPRTKCS